MDRTYFNGAYSALRESGELADALDEWVAALRAQITFKGVPEAYKDFARDALRKLGVEP